MDEPSSEDEVDGFSPPFIVFKQCVLDFIPDVLGALEHLGNALGNFLSDLIEHVV